jgi:hypothetical protein
MEAKLNQQLAWVDQEPLYQIYLDLRKAYNALNRGRCLKILAGYGVRHNLLRLQKQFWDDAKMVCRAGGNYGESFGAYRGVLQGGPLSSLMFNVCVDCMIREWIRQVLGEDAARDGLREAVRDHMVAFFLTMGWLRQDARSGCNHPSKSLSPFLNALDSEQMLKRLGS